VTRIILRFDDLCPTMRWDLWEEIESLLDRERIQPILAVVPENADAKLVLSTPHPDFWQQALRWHEKGWIIGQHGYRHVYDSTSAGLVPWWNRSEFAGHPYAVQYERMSAGQRVLRARGLETSVWVAPSHSFDETTLEVLRDLGFEFLSDGWGARPYRDNRGLIWIPQQPWKPFGLPFDVWTVTFHHNTLLSVAPIRKLIDSNRNRLMGRAFSFEELVREVPKRGIRDAAWEAAYGGVLQLRRKLAHRLRRTLPSSSAAS
jgi:peptidoglycan/xylan/chitin deacetylase (PgdA/CDA1 family)